MKTRTVRHEPQPDLRFTLGPARRGQLVTTGDSALMKRCALRSFDATSKDPGHHLVRVSVQLLACEILIARILDLTFLEIAVRGVHVAERHTAGARTLTELIGISGFDGTDLEDVDVVRQRCVNVRIDLWILELIEELAESKKMSRIRAFIRDAVLAYVDLMAASQPAPGAADADMPPREATTRTAS